MEKLPSAFFWRRLQSFMGIWLVFFLIEHLFTNSQAALLIGEDGSGFVRAVNFIHNLPFLPIVEIVLLGIPFLIHGVWGIKYLFTSRQNAYGEAEKKPRLAYPRNYAYTWQRITSWLLLIGVIGHVAHMRFYTYPASAKVEDTTYFMTRVEADPGLVTLAERLDVDLYTPEEVEEERAYRPERELGVPEALQEQREEQGRDWIAAMTKRPITSDERIAVTDNFGTAELLVVRNAFKSPLMIALYSFFVLAATYHGFNGLWTFCITWGITLTDRAQNLMRRFSTLLMVVLSFLGLAAIWGTYWTNLYG